MFSLLVIVLGLLVLNSSCDACTAPYWEVSKSNSIPVDEASDVGSRNLTLSTVEKSQTKVGVKRTWTLSSIKGTSRYDNASITVKFQNDTVSVGNINLIVNLTFNATRTNLSAHFTAQGRATVNATVNYAKRVSIVDNQVGFQFLNSTTTFVISSISYSPNPSQEDRTAFEDLLNKGVTNQLKEYYNTVLAASIKQQVSKEKINATFAGVYQYTFNNFSARIDMGLSSSAFSDKAGVAIGHNGSIEGQYICAQKTPYDFESNKATFFSIEFLQTLFGASLKSNPDWVDLKVDYSSSSDIFEFQMKDLADIVPDAIKEYPGLFVKVYAKCYVAYGDSDSLVIDAEHNRLTTSIVWDCTLYRAGGFQLLGFMPNLTYTLSVSQTQNQLTSKISSVEAKGISYRRINFDIHHQDTATLYLRSVLGQFARSETLGTNFTQPSRANAKVAYASNYIKIFDVAASSGEQLEI